MSTNKCIILFIYFLYFCIIKLFKSTRLIHFEQKALNICFYPNFCTDPLALSCGPLKDPGPKFENLPLTVKKYNSIILVYF